MKPRLYDKIVAQSLKEFRQMVFLSGPRQVGKTTVAKAYAKYYLNWDKDSVKNLILSGQESVGEFCSLERARVDLPVIAFDEIHKYPRWKQFLKGFFDDYESSCRVIATGSARMDVYKKGGDSMMGRYFPYRVHPLSVAELLTTDIPGDDIVRLPAKIPEEEWEALCEFGGFPEPFIKRSRAFSSRWNRLRKEQLLKIDIRDMSRTSEIDRLGVLADMLSNRSGEQLVYASIGNEIKIDEKTVKSWVIVFKHLFYGFEIRPWFKNVENSIRKTPKWFLRDWSLVTDAGKRFETMIACHLLKAVECWTDLGLGEFELCYLRDKQKHEVDFLIVKDRSPWILVEAKKGDGKLSDNLVRFHEKLKTSFAFQVVESLPYEEINCFSYDKPVVVPARTFLSQLV
jgi:predicted AAA+ superfamily ATPase